MFPLASSTMQYLRPSHKKQPLSALWDQKAQKCGMRHTVFSVVGNEYTGEWQDNKKHGEKSKLMYLV